jgi:hypothetical protein
MTQPSPTEVLWKVFAGMFGGDVIERKYGVKAPEEWVIGIAALRPFEVDRGIKRLRFSGKAHPPTLPEFLRLCREVGGYHDYDQPTPPARQLADESNPEMDVWERVGNQRLWKIVLRECTRYNATRRTAILVKWKKEWAKVMRGSDKDDWPDGGKDLWNNCMTQAREEIAGDPLCKSEADKWSEADKLSRAQPNPAQAANWWESDEAQLS